MGSGSVSIEQSKFFLSQAETDVVTSITITRPESLNL
jgi:hypothetical protein